MRRLHIGHRKNHKALNVMFRALWLKIYYATQCDTQPPTFVLFVNDETLMVFSYERYLENYFRKTFDFTGTPIRFILRERKK